MSEYININKLFEKLPEQELKAVQVYFDDFITDKFYKYKINVKILFLSLVYKEGHSPGQSPNTQKVMTYKEFRELFPECEWLTIPKRSFGGLTSGSQIRLMKAYIKADRINYKTSFYHECVVKECENQNKLNEFIKNRSDAKVEIVNELASKCNINEDEIDPDEF